MYPLMPGVTGHDSGTVDPVDEDEDDVLLPLAFEAKPDDDDADEEEEDKCDGELEEEEEEEENGGREEGKRSSIVK